jgi:hypothetical protein
MTTIQIGTSTYEIKLQKYKKYILSIILSDFLFVTVINFSTTIVFHGFVVVEITNKTIIIIY